MGIPMNDRVVFLWQRRPDPTILVAYKGHTHIYPENAPAYARLHAAYLVLPKTYWGDALLTEDEFEALREGA